MNIRPARKDDVKTIQNLNDEVFIDNSKYDPDLKSDWAQSNTGKAYFSNAINNPEAICLIAEENNVAIGYLFAEPKDIDYRLSRYIEIENMGVSPKYRSAGIGSRLMAKCFEIAKTKGFQRAYVNVYFNNLKAVKFYEKNGFNKIDLCLDRDL